MWHCSRHHGVFSYVLLSWVAHRRSLIRWAESVVGDTTVPGVVDNVVIIVGTNNISCQWLRRIKGIFLGRAGISLNTFSSWPLT